MTIRMFHVIRRANPIIWFVEIYWAPYKEMKPGEAISFVATKFLVSDVKVREVGVEEILKDIYRRDARHMM